ncbi:MAG TPA: GldG family protein [Kiritimatiellia bacterium]|nr:GldG family protein [Kiritimatiellia bacterium]
MKSNRFKLATGAAGLLVALVALVLLNVVAGAVRVRADLTADALYTLSPGTRQLVAGLGRDVTLKLYYSRSADQAPQQFKQYGRRIVDLLREYQTAGGRRLTLEILDPRPDSDAEEWAQRYGLSATRLDAAGDRDPVYLGLVAMSGARQSVIPFFSPADEPQLEFLVTRLIHEVTITEKPKLGVISPLPIMGTAGMPWSMGREQPPWIALQEIRAIAELVELPGSLREVPADIETVLVVHPRNIPDAAMYALDQFVLRGGRLIAFLDPQCLTELESQSRQLRDPFQVRSELNRLTSAWGVTMEADRVVADPRAATRVTMPDGRIDRHRGWLTLRPENFNKTDVAIAALNLMQMPMAGWFRVEPVDGVTVTPLITASAEAGSMSSAEASMGTAMGFSSFREEAVPLHLAVRVAGRFKTAFPEGRPENPDQPGPAGTPDEAPHRAESEKETTIVLVADVDGLFDAFAARSLPMYGRGVYQLINDNINFAANLAGQLAGGDALLALRGRSTFDRPFQRVLDLQAEAQERWRQEELKLQEQLRLTQMRIDELQAGKDADQKLIVSPEQRLEIENFRSQLSETQRQLRGVRKNLRGEIEKLGLWVKAANIGAMPALVILFGLVHGWRRRRGARG